MNHGNVFPISTEKILIKRKAYSKVNISKNLRLMNLPEFHLNRTIKAYINNKLNKTKNHSYTKNLTENNSPAIKIKMEKKPKNQHNNLTRINKVFNILKPKKILIKNNYKKIKKSFTPKLNKKIYKSKNKSRLNINSYILNYQKKSDYKRKNNQNKNLNNSTKKYKRYIGSTSAFINTSDQPKEKTTSLYQQYNQIKSNNSSLDFHNKQKPCIFVHTTSKKSKFNNLFFEKEKKFDIRFSKLNKLKKQSNEIRNIIMNKNNINNKKSINLENNFNRNSFNINRNPEKNDIMNLNFINNTENNIIYNKTESNHIYLHDCDISDKTLSKIDNISSMNNKSIEVKMNITNQKIKDDNAINNFNSKNDNSFNYIKKIEKLENENKLLKNEINDSKYKLQLLEDKINKLLLGKRAISMDKEECPEPSPYVKKYSAGILQNNK